MAGNYLTTRVGLSSTPPRSAKSAPGFLTTRKGIPGKGPSGSRGTVNIMSGRR